MTGRGALKRLQCKLQEMRIWVVPLNDGEAHEIVRLLRETGERVLVSEQRWGAKWGALEPELKRELDLFRTEHPNGEVIGVELGGSNWLGARDLDHHLYDDVDRRRRAPMRRGLRHQPGDGERNQRILLEKAPRCEGD